MASHIKNDASIMTDTNHDTLESAEVFARRVIDTNSDQEYSGIEHEAAVQELRLALEKRDAAIRVATIRECAEVCAAYQGDDERLGTSFALEREMAASQLHRRILALSTNPTAPE